MLTLAAGDYRLDLDPERGGSVAAFAWRGEPLFRPTCGPSVLDTGCFPLAPFSNRIGNGRFDAVRLSPNFPGSDHPHTIHGFGWLAAWEVIEAGVDRAVLRHAHEPGEWPWRYVAEQRFELGDEGLVHALSLRNLSESPMPAGLGVHPYFPRSEHTVYRALHRGEWQTASDGLPVLLQEAGEAIDWSRGAPVSTRAVDTVYTGREGPLTIQWPERGLVLTISPSEDLSFTVVYVPGDGDFFCVEPVSHETDALNHPAGAAPMRWIAPGEAFAVDIRYAARRL